MGTRERLRRQRRARRRAAAGVFIVLGAAVAVAAAVRYLELRAMPEPYDLAASRRCLSKTAVVRRLRVGGDWVFPGLAVRFRDDGPEEVLNLSFAPNVEAAKAAEVLDSERLQRRRNVVNFEFVADAPWDPRVVRCLRERAST
jgi:hypothetical protein